MEWKEKFEKGLTQGVDSSKRFLEGAKKQAKKIGEQSVLSLEIKQLEAKNKEQMLALGERVYQMLVLEGRSTVSSKSSGVKELINELEDIRSLLETKRAEMKREDEKKSSESG